MKLLFLIGIFLLALSMTLSMAILAVLDNENIY
jgi:hypothetical protein